MRNKNLVATCLLLLTFCSKLSTQQQPTSQLETVKQWNLLTYNFPWDWPVNDKTLYNPEQTVTTGIEVGKDRIFLATPRLFSGVPATLSVISKDSVGDSPVLEVSLNEDKTKRLIAIFMFSLVFRPIPTGATMRLV
jgi:hypothetical protein